MSLRRDPVASLVVLVLLVPLAGCGDDDGEADKKAKPVDGTFVSKVDGTQAFVSVVAAPPAKGQDKRVVTVFACDAKRLCEEFAGSASGNSFTLGSAGEKGQAKGTLSAEAASGMIEPPDGKTLRYKAPQATATSGLYDLTVSTRGGLRGASAAGVALKGNVKLPPPGSGSLKLADGKRVKFAVVGGPRKTVGVRPGQVRLIVLPDRQLRGAGRSREGGKSTFLIRSTK
jgi:hypothetical protein